MASKISRYISAWLSSCLLLLMVASPLLASPSGEVNGFVSEARRPRPASTVDGLPFATASTDTTVVVLDSTTVADAAEAVAEILGKKPEKKVHFINGFGVGADLVGLIQKIAGSDWSQMEVLARMNIKERFFPVFELGLGEADHEGRDLDNRFHVRAPYFRVGCDYNIRAKHVDGNRLFVGLRYGFSFYNYDLTSPTPIKDPVWGTEQPFDLEGLSGSAHWGEVVIGLETRLWSIIRLGWDVRFKLLIGQKADEVGEPWYLPGLGKRPDGIGWGGTFKIMFDI
ncbi:MAG: hypothetical protein IKO85_09000 [Bacteroidaceae bacterium]|nr:hypothetical protein [Bacteroidaceae bacterium]